MLAFLLEFSLAEAAVETPKFVARRAELEEMHKHLDGESGRKVIVLLGLGGIGKTQLAMQYAKKHKDEYSALLWLNAKDETSLQSSFVAAARQIRRQHPDALAVFDIDQHVDEDEDEDVDQSVGQEVGQVVDRSIKGVQQWLSMPSNTGWLLIYDNYDNPKVYGREDSTAFDLRKYMPHAYQGKIIVTTRSSEVGVGHCIRLRSLGLQDGLEILGYFSGRGELEKGEWGLRLVRCCDLCSSR